MRYSIKPKASQSIWSFYRNVARKYKHTYSVEDRIRNVQDAVRAIYLIEQTLLRRRPILSRWQNQGFYMAHAGQWYYAYTINGDTITIEDACHEQNMHED